MRRLAPLAPLFAAVFAAAPVSAQSDPPMVYMQSIKTDFADMPAWIEYFQQHEVPVLEALVDEGLLLGFGLWAHDTGGDYNLRYNFVVPNRGAVSQVGAAYFQRVDSAALWAMIATVREMTDELWVIGASNLPPETPLAPYVYESVFQVRLADMQQWNADFERYTRPALERAMEQGLIQSWAKLDHSIGGPWNSRHVYWLTSWGAAEELNALMGRTAQELGATMEGAASLQRHTDVIWRPIPRAGNE